MKLTRRETIQVLASLGAVPLMFRAGTTLFVQPTTNFRSQELRGRAQVLGELTTGGNVLGIPTADGPIMVDAKFAHTAPDLMQDMSQTFGSAPRLIINTHHHADHTGGNWLFAERGEIVAHRNLNLRIEANLANYVQQAESHLTQLQRSEADSAKVKAADDLVERIRGLQAQQYSATREIDEEFYELDHGQVQLHCYHYGNGHTDNDVIVLWPKENILHMGDLLFHQLHPFIDRNAKADTRAWQRALQQAIELCDDETIVIPGHGELTDRQGIRQQYEYFEQLRDLVAQAIEQGKTRDEVAAMRFDAFSEYQFDQIRPRTHAAMFDELTQ